jgi:uncharacterized OB-fold protein
MGEVTLPKSLEGVELVKSVRTPAEIRFQYTAGEASTKYLKGIADKKILGGRVAAGDKVYVPPRGADPQLGKPTTEMVEVAHVGTLVSFCVVNVSFYGGTQEIPYVTGLIKLDGSDLPIMHLVQEVPVVQVRIGMRVEAVWVDDADLGPTMESIKWFRPNGEPDADVHIPGEDRPLWLDSEEFNRA